MSSTMISMSGTAVVPGMVNFSLLSALYSPNFTLLTLFSRLVNFRHLLRREVLRHKIFGRIRHAKFVSPTIHHGVARPKVVGGRRRRDAPFERGGAPGIAFHNFFASKEAPEKITEEEPLRENGKENRDGDERVNRGSG